MKEQSYLYGSLCPQVEEKMPEIRVLIADDHTILREGLKALFASSLDIKVVGEASNGLEAVDLARSLAPDVVLMDIAMPGLGGLEATVHIHKEYPKVKVLVLTQYDDKEYLLRLLRAGASGYVLKMAPARNVMAAVRLVHEGGVYLDTPDATELLAQAIQEKEPPHSGSYESLTDREKEVLKLIVDGMTSKQIAEALCVSIKTVVTHRTNLMEKLGIHNRAHLVRFGIRQGLIPLAQKE